MTQTLLEVRNLRISFHTEEGLVRAVDDVSFTVDKGEVLGIVGESGSGKTVTMMSIIRLIKDPNAVVSGAVLYKGNDVTKLPERELRKLRGAEIAMIFQDPMTSLSPVYRVGWQIEESIREHQEVSSRAARRRAIELLESVGIPNAAARADDYPHQFSGGMRQRVMIAMALANDPDLLIADEPTTALDVTIQAQIITLLKRLRNEFGSSVIVVTHDMGVIADIATRVQVMYAGRIMEDGTKYDVFDEPQHPYTWGLLGSIPRLDRPKPARLPTIPGQPPSLLGGVTGCAFASRCPYVFDRCTTERPMLTARSGLQHRDACHLDPGQKARLRAPVLDPESVAT